MRRLGFGFLILAAAVGLTTAAVAEDGGSSAPTPSLEYKPPRQVVPEPKAPHPLPPLTVFRESVGSFGMLEGSFIKPSDVARDKSDNFYVLDTGNNRIQKFDRFSKFVASWGSHGIRDGEFSHPTAIAVGPFDTSDPTIDFVYVVDTGNNRIQIFNTVGKHIKSWGTRGSRDGDFDSPQGITFDGCRPDWNIYVLDGGNERVQIFDKNSKFINKWDKWSGVTGGIFADLTSIAWSEERLGYIYLLSAGCVVQQFKPDGCTGRIEGTLINSWPAVAPESGLCSPARIEVDNKNNYVYVLDSGNSLLMCFNPDGLYRWALRGADRPFSKPLGFAINPDGDEVLVADTENNIVQKFTLR